MVQTSIKPKIHKMTLVALRGELNSMTSSNVCKCYPCMNRIDALTEEILMREAAAVHAPEGEDLSGYDPVLLAAGIRAPIAKKKRYLEPAARVAAGKRLSNLIFRQRTTGAIADEQDKLDRLLGLRGKVVRG